MAKRIKVEHKKIGRHHADGLAYQEERRIVIDERLKGKAYLGTAIHELLHVHRPDLTEEEVTKLSDDLCNDLWDLKIRKIDE